MDSGAAYLFVRSGTTWTQQAKLTASDAADDDAFGKAVAISGDTALIGAEQTDDDGLNSGSAYVFTRSETTWTEQAKLTALDAAESDRFGNAVAIEVDTVMVGAYNEDDKGFDAGSAYVFSRSGSTWTQEAKLTASDGAAHSWFGSAVALSAGTAVIGAVQDGSNGAAYVFTRSGRTWTEEAKLTASDGSAGDDFGVSVAVDLDTTMVGARGDDDHGSNSGSAYVFTRNGTTWTEEAKLTASDAAENNELGWSTAISGDTGLVSALFNTVPLKGSGTVYVFGPPPPNMPPVAAFSAVCSDLDCSFTDESSDSDGSVVSWLWDFGDGGSSTEQNPSHSYAAAGDYTVSLTVTDDDGETDSVNELVSVTEPPQFDDTFVDDDDSIFESDIEWLAAEGITKGCNPPTNDRFCPNDFVTRGQMAAFLVRALGYTDDGGGDLFTDDDDSIFETDIDKLGTAGVIKGCNPPTNDRFCPNDFVTRGQMAAFLKRALSN